MGPLPAIQQNTFERDARVLRRLLNERHIFRRIGTARGVVEDKTALVNMRRFGAEFNLGGWRIFVKRQIQKREEWLRRIRNLEAFVGQILGVGQKRLLFRRGNHAKAAPPLRFPVGDAALHQVVCVAVALERAGHPKAVDVKIPRRLDGNPRILRRDVLDEALAALRRLEKDQPFVQSVPQPRLFGGHLWVLVVGDGAADMLPLQIFRGQ
ncbi:hypothetical protein SDC9_89672 [bioreactor metagenome]|uniref:Uncharacterized protein n=1 Tax=bioreactor metagenome TaxID=1076179 RepID=A0A644ZPW5_9ZZZZ